MKMMKTMKTMKLLLVLFLFLSVPIINAQQVTGVPKYAVGISYKTAALVVYQGAIYKSNTATTGLPTSADWDLLPLLGDGSLITNINISNITLDSTDLVVVPETDLQLFAEGVDHAILKDRGTGVSTTYVSTVSVGGTTFNMPEVKGEINSDEGYFDIHYLGATGISVNDLTSPSTYVYIDNSGNRQQQTTTPTRQDWGRKIFTMRIGVDTNTNLIIGFEYLNNPIGHYANSTRDLYSYLLSAGIPFKKDQLITGRATDLGFDVSAGSFFEFGGTGNIDEPNTPPRDAVANTSYNLMSRTALVSSETDLVKFWDNNTVITALGSTTFVGHRLYRFSNGNFAMQYGQGNYANIDLAKAGVRTEDYVLNPALKNATFFGWWLIESTATNTGGTTLTKFIEYSIGTQGGSSSSLSGAVLRGNNGSDFLDIPQTRTNLGLGNFTDPNTFTGNLTVTGDGYFGGPVTITDKLYLADNLDNIWLSKNTGTANTTGINNIAIGVGSLNLNTIGLNNTALGFESLFSNTTGDANISLGVRSLYSNTTGGSNIALGSLSLYSNTTGDSNLSLGFWSLYSNTTGGTNTSLGRESLYSNTTGSQNVAVGYRNLYSNIDGGYNIVSGSQNLFSNISGSYNIGQGHNNLYNNTTGTHNVSIGHKGNYSNISGDFNITLGHEALYFHESNSDNIAIGRSSGKYIADGTTANTTPNRSIFIGRHTYANADGESNQIVIGDGAIGNGSNTVTLGDDNITDTYLKGNVDITGNVTATDGLFSGKFQVITNQSAGGNPNNSQVGVQIDTRTNSDLGGLQILTGDSNGDEPALLLTNYLDAEVFRINGFDGDLISQSDAVFSGNVSATDGIFSRNLDAAELTLTNAGPLLTAQATNGTSGLRFNLTGASSSSSNAYRWQYDGGTIAAMNGLGAIDFSSSVTANDKVRTEGVNAFLEFYDTSEAQTATVTYVATSDHFEFSDDIYSLSDIIAVGTVSGATIRPKTSYTFATLPTVTIGTIAHITDASTISYRADAAGGGSDFALVVYNGTKWIYH